MRILRLTMDAVGPFPGHEVIDFEAFSDAGRFLLSGPTGAGKSTIIDAIVFALANRPMNGLRKTVKASLNKTLKPGYLS